VRFTHQKAINRNIFHQSIIGLINSSKYGEWNAPYMSWMLSREGRTLRAVKTTMDKR